jgi:hypothetical protein
MRVFLVGFLWLCSEVACFGSPKPPMNILHDWPLDPSNGFPCVSISGTTNVISVSVAVSSTTSSNRSVAVLNTSTNSALLSLLSSNCVYSYCPASTFSNATYSLYFSRTNESCVVKHLKVNTAFLTDGSVAVVFNGVTVWYDCASWFVAQNDILQNVVFDKTNAAVIIFVNLSGMFSIQLET